MTKKTTKAKQKKAGEKAKQSGQGSPPARKASSKRTGISAPILDNLNTANVILLIILAAVLAIIIIGPFQRGLFFQQELLPVHVISFALFLLWWISKLWRRDVTFLQTPLDAGIFVLVLLYFLAFLFTAVDKRAALEEFLKVANYFVVYLMVFDIARRHYLLRLRREPVPSRSQKNKEVPRNDAVWSSSLSPGLLILLHGLLVAGVAVAVAGIGAAAGTWDIHGAYVNERIHSPLQYPNTAAAYFTASYFLALGLSSLARRWYLRALYLVPAVVLAIAIIFTYSRGAWLLLPFMALLFILAMLAGNRMRVALHLVVSGAVTLLVMPGLNGAFASPESGSAWLYIFGALALAVFFGLLVEKFLHLDKKFKLAAAGVAVLALILLGMQLVLPRLNEPLHLERALNEEPSEQYLEQRVSNIEPDHPYLLSFDVSAFRETPDGEEEPSYAWGMQVYGYDIEDERTTLLEHREEATDGWESRQLEFSTAGDTVRAEVRLYNRYPGTSVTISDVTLLENDTAQTLGFTLDRLLPRQVYERLHTIGAGEHSVEGRLGFYRVAMSIVADYPILGAGGGGWTALYLGYQDVLYYTTEVHSHFLQVWVETGTLGFAAFLAVWGFFILSFIRARRSNSLDMDHKTVHAAVFIAALALGAHSALDFNLSLGAVSLFLFALLGAGRSLCLDPGREGEMRLPRIPRLRLNERPKWVPGLIGVVIALILFLFTLFLWSGHRTAQTAAQLAQGGQLQPAVRHYESALRYDPYQASNYLALADHYGHMADMEEDEEKVPQFKARALELSRRALELEPYSVSTNEKYGLRLLSQGRVEQAMGYIEKILQLHPHSPGTFTSVAQAHLLVAEYYGEQNNEDSKEYHYREVLKLEERMLDYHDDIGPLNFFVGEAAFQLGELEDALVYFRNVVKVEEEPEWHGRALAYRAVIHRLWGEEERALELEEEFAEKEGITSFYEELLRSQNISENDI